MAKPTTKQSLASTKLLDINHALHEVMADLMVAIKTEEGISTLPADQIKHTVAMGEQAIAAIKPIDPKTKQLPFIEKLTAAVSSVLEIIPEENGILTMPEDAATALINMIINNLANQVHDAAMAFIGASGTIQGCNVSELLPDEATDVNKYCTGVLNSLSKAKVFTGKVTQETVGNKTIVTHLPQVITHTLGMHKVDISTHGPSGDSAEVAIEYHESGPGYADSKNRMKGVQQLLESEGFDCAPKYPLLYCHGEMVKDKLTRLAAFFSLLYNGDIHGVSPDKPSVISEKVWDIASQLVQKHGLETWQAPQEQLNWSAVRQQWLQDKEIYQKQTVYTDMRNLAILRDKHHEIEAKYGVEQGKPSKPGALAIVANAKEAVSILKKNGWSYSSLANAISTMENAAKAGQLHNIVGLSDGIGHTMHMILANILAKEGQYGGCSTDHDVGNVNAANLAYCEGVLKGTAGSFSKQGNMVTHKVAPNTYMSFILDENPDGTYDITVDLPESPEWRKKLSSFFTKHKNFHCTGHSCKANIKDLDSIRSVALFFSNLRGAGEAIGSECGNKAIDIAAKAADEQNEKGVFAFTQEPVMSTPKAWIDICHKQFNILPPGLTEEEKKSLLTIGSEKQYAGCDFSGSEVLPNPGILVYCEGVRKNPLANISAYMQDNGKLYHFFHGTTDKLADVNIIPMGADRYQVEVAEIDLGNTDLTKAVVEALKKSGFACSGNLCTEILDPDQIRLTAAFLSSFHHAYKPSVATPDCIPKVIKATEAQVAGLPNDKTAHDSVVHPFYEKEWLNEVCGKGAEVLPSGVVGFKQWLPPFETLQIAKQPWSVPKAHIVHLVNAGISKQNLISLLKDHSFWPHDIGSLPYEIAEDVANLYMPAEKAAPEVAPEKVYGGYGPTPKPPFKMFGCTSITKQIPTVIKRRYCQGVVGKVQVGTKIEPFELANMLMGTAAVLGPTENKHNIGGVDVVFDSKWNNLYITLPDELTKITPLTEALQHKFNMAKQSEQTYIKHYAQHYTMGLARFLSYVSGIHTLPEWCWQAAVDYAYQKTTKTEKDPVIYPYADYDWEKEVCAKAPEAPAPTPTKAPMKNYADLTPAEQESVKKDMKYLIHLTPELKITHIKAIREKYNLQLAGLPQLWDKMKAEVEAEKAVILTPDQLKETILSILQIADNNKSEYETILKAIQAYHPYIQGGPAGEVGTVTWAMDELLKQKLIAYYGGTTYGLPEAVPGKAKWSELPKETQLEVAKTAKDFKEHGFNDTYSWGQLEKIFQYIDFTTVPNMPTLLEMTIEAKPYLNLQELKAAVFDIIKSADMADFLYIQHEIQESYAIAAGNIKTALDDLAAEDKIHFYGGTTWGMPEKPSIDELIKEQQKVQSGSWYKVTDDMWKKTAEIHEYKKLPKPVKDWMHAMMNLKLLVGHKEGNPEYALKEAEKGTIHGAYPIPITPLMVKLQLDLEKKRKIRKGELPAEPGEKVAKKYEELSENEKGSVDDAIKEELEKVGPGQAGTINTATIAKEAGIEDEQSLWNAVNKLAKGEVTQPTLIDTIEDIYINNPEDWMAPDQILDIIGQGGTELEGMPSLTQVKNAIHKLFDQGKLIFEEDSYKLKTLEEAEKEYHHYSEMPLKIQGKISSEILTLVQKGMDASTIKNELETTFPELEWDENIENIIELTITAKEAPQVKPMKHIEMAQKVKNWIFETLNNAGPNTWFTAGGLHVKAMGAEEFATGFAPGIEVIQVMLSELTEEGQLLWELAGDKYAINPEAGEKEGKLKYYSDLTFVKQKQVLDDINKAKKFGTTNAELIIYLHEGYGIFTDTPLQKMIDEIYGKPQMKSINELTDDEIKEASEFVYSKMVEGISIPVIKADLADQFPGGIIKGAEYDTWVNAIVDAINAAHPGLIEKGLKFSDLSELSKDYMNSYIKTHANIPFTQVYDDVSLQFNVKKSKPFKDWAYNVWLDAQEKPQVEELTFQDLTPAMKTKMATEILGWYQGGMKEENIYKNLAAAYNLAEDPETEKWIEYEIAKAKGEEIEEEEEAGAMEGELSPLEKKMTKEAEMQDFIIGFLSSNPGVKFNAQDIDYALNKAGHETKGIIPTGDLLVKMAKEGTINWSEKLPYSFWMPKEAKKKTYDQLSEEGKLQLQDAIEDMLKDEFAKEVHIFEEAWESIESDLPVVKTKPGLKIAAEKDWEQWIEATKAMEQKPQPPVSEVAAAIQKMEKAITIPKSTEEQMVDLIKMGWSAEGLTNYFSDKIDEKALAKKVNDLIKLYKPDYRLELTYDAMTTGLQDFLKNLAWQKLNEGKGIHDVAWYISKNYAMNKASVLPMVKEQAEKPLEQVASMLVFLEQTEPGNKIGGCKVDTKLTDLRPTIVSYCQGAYSEPPYTAGIFGTGAIATHTLPTKYIQLNETGDGGEFKLHLHTAESGQDWSKVDPEIAKVLQDLGFSCKEITAKAGSFINCDLTGEDKGKLSIANQDRIRKAALLLSSVEGIPELSPECIPKAVAYAFEQARNKNQTSKPWSIPPYPKTKKEWDEVVCSKL